MPFWCDIYLGSHAHRQLDNDKWINLTWQIGLRRLYRLRNIPERQYTSDDENDDDPTGPYSTYSYNNRPIELRILRLFFQSWAIFQRIIFMAKWKKWLITYTKNVNNLKRIICATHILLFKICVNLKESFKFWFIP